MIAFKDEFLKFRDINSRTVISFDLIFKKCPVCGRERQIYDQDEYLLKIRRPGKPTLYFDRESCLKKYRALHPELNQAPRKGRSPEYIARCRQQRAIAAKAYMKLWHEGLTYKQIGMRFGKTANAIRSTIEHYKSDLEKAVLV